jgi:hypothetical protein
MFNLSLNLSMTGFPFQANAIVPVSERKYSDNVLAYFVKIGKNIINSINSFNQQTQDVR